MVLVFDAFVIPRLYPSKKPSRKMDVIACKIGLKLEVS